MKISLYLLIAVIAFSTSCTKRTIACFTNSSKIDSTGTVVTFDAGCSQSASLFTWNFGDGSSDTMLSWPTIDHVYTTAGTYTVELNVLRKDGITLGRDEFTFTRSIQVN